MADRLKHLGDFSLDGGLVTSHEWICDFLIDGFPGRVCQLIYQAKNEECPNCYMDGDTGESTSIYKAGGPVPFENYTICPYCAGAGHLYKEETENIRLRVYYNQRQFIQTAETKNIIIDGDTIQVIGYMIDMPKIERAKFMIVDKQVEGYKQYKFQPISSPNPHGFRHNRYFIQLWKRAV